MELVWVLLGLFILCIVLCAFGVKTVPHEQAYVIERMGKQHQTWGEGVHFMVPALDRIVRRVSLKEQIMSFPPCAITTKNNITVRIDVDVLCRIKNPTLFVYATESPMCAVERTTINILRNIVKGMLLDEVLKKRDKIDIQLCADMAKVAISWGIEIESVRLQNILPPADVQNFMEKKAKELMEAEAAAKILKMRQQAMKGE